MQTHPLQTRSHEPASDHTCASDRSATISQGSDGLEHLRRNQWHRTARPTAVVARPRGCIWRRDDAVVRVTRAGESAVVHALDGRRASREDKHEPSRR